MCKEPFNPNPLVLSKKDSDSNIRQMSNNLIPNSYNCYS